jgi:hypothetical protein
LWLFWEFVQSYVLCIIYRDDRSDTDEVECIANLTPDVGEGELATTILSTLSNISNIPDRLTVEILQIYEIKKSARPLEVTDISDDIREGCIDIGLIEFSMKREYLDTSVGTGFFYFELGKHKKRDRK